MITLFLLAQVVATAPPVSPEAAVRILLASRSELNRTNAISLEALPPGPVFLVIPAQPGSGPWTWPTPRPTLPLGFFLRDLHGYQHPVRWPISRERPITRRPR